MKGKRECGGGVRLRVWKNCERQFGCIAMQCGSFYITQEGIARVEGIGDADRNGTNKFVMTGK